MKSRLLLLPMVLFGVLLFEGCATHAPISETVMFRDTVPSESHKSVGPSLSYSPISEDIVNKNGLSGGIYLVKYDRRGKYAISGTVGVLVTGVDATFKLWDRNFLTAGASIPGHLELYLQHRTLNNSKFGMALGFGYQREALTYYGEEYVFDTRGRNSFGLRGFVIIRDEANPSSPASRIGVYVGYVPLTERPIIQLSFQGGRF